MIEDTKMRESWFFISSLLVHVIQIVLLLVIVGYQIVGINKRERAVELILSRMDSNTERVADLRSRVDAVDYNIQHLNILSLQAYGLLPKEPYNGSKQPNGQSR